jgi:hypothetical protein
VRSRAEISRALNQRTLENFFKNRPIKREGLPALQIEGPSVGPSSNFPTSTPESTIGYESNESLQINPEDEFENDPLLAEIRMATASSLAKTADVIRTANLRSALSKEDVSDSGSVTSPRGNVKPSQQQNRPSSFSIEQVRQNTHRSITKTAALLNELDLSRGRSFSSG